MKTITTILFSFILSLSISFGQAPAITIVVNSSIDPGTGQSARDIYFQLKGNTDNTQIQIDFGDGVLINKTIRTTDTSIGGHMTTDTLKIYGSGISALNCNNIPLRKLDVTNAASLAELVCNHSYLTSLDLSGNPSLVNLNCYGNALEELNIRNNPALEFLSCSLNYLNNLDLSHNNSLTYLYCSLNKITSLDVSNKPFLKYVQCYYNLISTLNVNNDPSLIYLSCENNLLTFATLPIMQPVWTTYNYASQKNIGIEKTIYSGDIINLSSQLTVNGNFTTFTWKTRSGASLVPGVDFTVTDGTTKFLKEQPDSVCCELTNAAFPILPGDNVVLKTSYVKVNGWKLLPTIIMTTSGQIGSDIGFTLSANANNVPVKVDFGDGILISQTIGIDNTFISGIIVASQTILIYGDGITSFNGSNQKITKLNISNNSTLQEVNVSENELTSLDLTNNTNLQYVSCNNNQLTYATLPIKQSAWATYNYAPQANIGIEETNSGEIIDLSSQLTVNGNFTAYTWKTSGGASLIPGVDFTITNGKTKFLKEQPDSVFCELTNTSFPDFSEGNVLKTRNIKVNEQIIPLAITIVVNSSIDDGSGQSPRDRYYTLKGNAINTPIQIDFGDGIFVGETIQPEGTLIRRSMITDTIKIYGSGITGLDCSNRPLRKLDITNAVSLTELVCGHCYLNSLDITNNPSLVYLDCQENGLQKLNVSNNPALKIMNCGWNDIHILDLSNNNSLTELRCFINYITSLDVSNKPFLEFVDCSGNTLKTLNVSNDPALKELWCGLYNQLTFATLPIKQSTWTNYQYTPQLNIAIEKTINSGEIFDLSSQLIVNGNYTNYTWKTQNGAVLTEGVDYTITSGKTIFLKGQTDSVYCEFTNAALPDFNGDNVLKTTFAKIQEEILPLTITLTTAKQIGANVTFSLNANTDHTPIQVDFGDGNLVRDTIDANINGPSLISGKLVGSQTVKVYGTGIVSFNGGGQNLTILDVKSDTSLSELICNNNHLSTLDISKNTNLGLLDCTNNQLTNLDLSNNTSLGQLSISSNLFTTIDLSHNKELGILVCQFGHLASLNLGDTDPHVIVCNSNQFTIATLPFKFKPNDDDAAYAPQAPIQISKSIEIGNELDLSNQLTFLGNPTVYTWKTIGSDTLIAGTDYTILNGKTTFLKPQTDSVNCELTNSFLPDFLGNLVLKTTNLKIMVSTGTGNIKTFNAEIFAFNHSVYINLPYEANITIVDIAGRVVTEKHLKTGTFNIALQNNGVYIVQLAGKEGVTIRKIVIE